MKTLTLRRELERGLKRSYRLSGLLRDRLKVSLPRKPSHLFESKSSLLVVGVDGGMAEAGLSMAVVRRGGERRDGTVVVDEETVLDVVKTKHVSTDNSEPPERRSQRLFRAAKGFVQGVGVAADLVCFEAFSQPRYSTSAFRLGIGGSSLLCGALTRARRWSKFRPHDTHPTIADRFGGESSKENTYEKMVEVVPEGKLPRHNGSVSEGPAGHVADATATIFATFLDDSSTIYEGEFRSE